jgi:hypothetical protein
MLPDCYYYIIIFRNQKEIIFIIFIPESDVKKHKGEKRHLVFTSKIKFALIILLTIVIIGTAGFHFIEGWSLLDSFYD